MEYVKTLLDNYSDLIKFDNEKTIKEQDNYTTIITSFPVKSLCTKKGKQFYVLGISYWVRYLENNVLQQTFFLIYLPAATGIKSNFHYNKDNFDRGQLFVKAINLNAGINYSPSIFIDHAIEYKKQYNTTPLFLALLSKDQINEIHEDIQEEFDSYI